MKKLLIRDKFCLYHFKDGVKVEGKKEGMEGDCSELRGNCSGLKGDCSGFRGDLDECEITDEDRKNGIRLEDLLEDDE